MNGTEIWSIDGIVDILYDFEHRDTCNFTWITKRSRSFVSSSSRRHEQFLQFSNFSNYKIHIRKLLTNIFNFSKKKENFETKNSRNTAVFPFSLRYKKFFQEETKPFFRSIVPSSPVRRRRRRGEKKRIYWKSRVRS